MTTANVSQNCHEGKHGRCLGTVIVYPPVDGQNIGPCQCQEPTCPHVIASKRESK